jgi:hypothetical protein
VESHHSLTIGDRAASAVAAPLRPLQARGVRAPGPAPVAFSSTWSPRTSTWSWTWPSGPALHGAGGHNHQVVRPPSPPASATTTSASWPPTCALPATTGDPAGAQGLSSPVPGVLGPAAVVLVLGEPAGDRPGSVPAATSAGSSSKDSPAAGDSRPARARAARRPRSRSRPGPPSCRPAPHPRSPPPASEPRSDAARLAPRGRPETPGAVRVTIVAMSSRSCIWSTYRPKVLEALAADVAGGSGPTTGSSPRGPREAPWGAAAAGRAARGGGLVVAGQRMAELPGCRSWGAVHELHPSAKRVLLVGRREWRRPTRPCGP